MPEVLTAANLACCFYVNLFSFIFLGHVAKELWQSLYLRLLISFKEVCGSFESCKAKWDFAFCFANFIMLWLVVRVISKSLMDIFIRFLQGYYLLSFPGRFPYSLWLMQPPLFFWQEGKKRHFFHSPRREAVSYQKNKDFSVYLSTQPNDYTGATGDF